MRAALVLALLVLGVPTMAHAVQHVIAWEYAVREGDKDFVIERCRNDREACLFADVGTRPLTARQYREKVPRRDYCYRVHVRNPVQGALQSNIVCTP